MRRTEAQRYLERLFTIDRADPAYFDVLPMYQFDVELGAMLWWPPLSEVWLLEGVPPEDQRPRARYWAEAWAHLQALHADYAARRR